MNAERRILRDYPLLIQQIQLQSDRPALAPDKLADMWRRDSNIHVYDLDTGMVSDPIGMMHSERGQLRPVVRAFLATSQEAT
ncbi:hypothetical protein [Phyllobacterium sp. SB3]|uniref:hypothetical protein n=1 Tax=Phyllobacterium sp. SB3 TaxID=3156073 RepID=UPI0032AFB09E